MIDLHCHSVFSDGALRPAELIQRAQEQQVQYLSLTDHDTVAGYAELHEAAKNSSVHIIQGIEFSTRWKKYDIHILGYKIHFTDELNQTIQLQNDSRIQRAKAIGTSLELLGISNAYEKACSLAGHNRIGRPHFARLLINEGKTRDMKSAFKQFLGRGRAAYIPTPWISVTEAVKVINAAKGQAVIAHPLKYGLTRSKLHELINEFKEAGGAGIEVVSGEMMVSEIKELAAICLRFNLLASSGSDFHGDTLSYTKLGKQKPLPPNCVAIWEPWISEQGSL